MGRANTMKDRELLHRDLQQWLRDTDDLRHRHPRRALLRARALRDLAASLEPPADGAAPEIEESWVRLQISAWAVLGSAYRGVGNRIRAESALAIALAFIERAATGPGRDLQLARLAQRLSYVRCDQQRFTEAFVLNDDAIRLFDQVGEPQLVASAQVDRALFFHRNGQTRRAIPLLKHALGQLDGEVHFRPFLAAVHNLGFYLSLIAEDLDQHQEAIAWLELGWRLQLGHSEEPASLRIRAVVALMDARRGHLAEAIEALDGCLDGFTDLGAEAEKAVVLLHLIALAFEENRLDDAERLKAQLEPILLHLDLSEPARTSIDEFFAEALSEGQEPERESSSPHPGARPENSPDALAIHGSGEAGAKEVGISEVGADEAGTGEADALDTGDTSWRPLPDLTDGALELDAHGPSSVGSTEARGSHIA